MALRLTVALALILTLASVSFAIPYTVHQALEPSLEPEESPDETPEEEVCVDASYLASYPSHNLVHFDHIEADVLCPQDSTLPCATSNHLVRVHGVPMSYGALCDEAKCVEKRMKVNSVYSHLWQEEKHGEDHVLTMFDVRHPEFVQKTLHRTYAAARSVARIIA